MKYHTIFFFLKIEKDVAKFVVCCSCDFNNKHNFLIYFCRFYHELVHCGVNATDTLEHGCTHAQVNAALMSEKDRVLAYFSNDPNMDTTAAAWVTIDPEICQCKQAATPKKTQNWLSSRLSLNAGQKFCRMLQESILQCF